MLWAFLLLFEPACRSKAKAGVLKPGMRTVLLRAPIPKFPPTQQRSLLISPLPFFFFLPTFLFKDG
jgi:hypothetical protein